jgi:type IV secretory pathway TraG/TraD family ATPase VirD4
MSKTKATTEVNPTNLDPLMHWATKFAQDNPMALAIMLLAGGYLAWDALKGPGPIKGSAYWANAGHIKRAKFLCKLQNIRMKPGKISYLLGNLPVYGAQTSMLSFGAPETGKSFGTLNQAIYKHLKLGQPEVIVDLQYPEQTQHFIPIALKFGYKPEDIHLFVPGEDTSGIWNPTQCAVGSKALEMAKSANANIKPPDAKSDGYFDPALESLLAGLMSTCRNIPGLDSILGCSAIASLPDLVKRIDENFDKLRAISVWDTKFYNQFRSNLRSEKTAANIVASLQNVIESVSTEDLYPCMSGDTTIPLFMDGKQLLIIGCTQKYRQSVSPILVMLLEQIIVANAVHGRKTNLQIAIDELNAINISKLKFYLNENRKYGVFFNLATQTITQLQDRYGEKGARAIMTACGFKAFFNPRENETAEYLQKALGTYKYRSPEHSSGYSGGKSSSNRSNPIKEMPLFSSDRAQKMPQGVAVFQTRGISSKSEEYIPWKTKIYPDEQYLVDMEEAKQEWHEHTEAALKRRSPVQKSSPEDLLQSIKIAEGFLPLDSTSEEKQVMDVIKRNNKVYQTMLDDL